MGTYGIIVIMGMKHTGKSTVGSLLAERLNIPFRDTDAVIEELSGKTARELYDAGGSALMMEKETEACMSLVGDSVPGGECVIATGGGLADNHEALAILKRAATCVYLDTPFDLLFRRVMASAERDGRLPRFLQGPDPEALFRELFARRAETYATMADVRIETGARLPEELAQEIMEKVRDEQRTDLHR